MNGSNHLVESDARPMHLGHCIDADARFRLFLFAPVGDTGAPGGTVAELCDWLLCDAASPLRRHTASGEDIDAVIDTRAVFQHGFRELEHASMPALLRPRVGRYGLCDYEKVFCADLKSGDLGVICSFGAGYSIGSVVVRRA